jgi:glycine/D-amino acid oxidase-like deaminating enzyme
MRKKRSPWTHQLPHRQKFPSLNASRKDDVVVVGAGIAGITTAYFVLTKTSRSVTLFEATRVAHGATGHNAGQLAQYFERPFVELVQEFGPLLAADGQRGIQEAFLDVQRIVQEEGLSSHVDVVTGYGGLQDLASVERMALDILAQKEAGLETEELLLAKNHPALRQLSPAIRALATWLPHADILSLLETEDRAFLGAVAGTKGCMNSALFTEELLGRLLQKYPQRIRIFENSPVQEVHIRAHDVVLDLHENVFVQAHDVVLCTNGFERIKLSDGRGDALDRWFHRTVRGAVGYMAGYLEERNLPPAAVSFLSPLRLEGDVFAADPYMYVTRRPFEHSPGKHANLVCIGGPEMLLDDTAQYRPLHAYPQHATARIQHFLAHTWKRRGRKKSFDFLWHGLMGYTPNGVRLAGRDPEHPHLFYNLGCNGVGILTSVMGSKRMARLLAGERLAPSIFDPLPERGLHKMHLAERIFAYTLFTVGMVLGVCLGGFISLGFLL